MAQHTVGSFLFDYLYSQGAHAAFGIPGDFALPTFRWLQASKIKLYTMTHEPSVGFAADGYARVHGLGVACVTYCVGGLNMVNPIACAYAEKSPVVVITGGPSPNDRKLDPLLHHKVRTFDTQRRIYEEVTCASTVLLDPSVAPEEIMRVVSAVQAQCRPGYIEVPYDVVDMPVRVPPHRNEPAPESDKENLEVAVAEAVDVIRRSRQPVIIADVELHRHGLTDLALDIARKFNIPVASTLLSKSVISETNPLYIGVYSGGLSEPPVQDYVDNSDCVILLGAFLTDMFFGINTARMQRKNTMLITTEKTRIGLHGYDNVLLKDFLGKLASADLPRKTFSAPAKPPAPKPLGKQERDEKLNAEAFFRILGLCLPENATVVCDTGDALYGSIALRTSHRNNFLADAYYLSMGFAVPAALGASIAAPDSRVYAIVGDGAFQMTGIELSTAAKYKMKPVICIINNDGYGTQRNIIDGPFNNIHPWDYTKIRELLRYGLSRRVDTKGGLEDALKEAATCDDMCVIEAVIPRDDCSGTLRRLGERLAEIRDAKKRQS